MPFAIFAEMVNSGSLSRTSDLGHGSVIEGLIVMQGPDDSQFSRSSRLTHLADKSEQWSAAGQAQACSQLVGPACLGSQERKSSARRLSKASRARMTAAWCNFGIGPGLLRAFCTVQYSGALGVSPKACLLLGLFAQGRVKALTPQLSGPHASLHDLCSSVCCYHRNTPALCCSWSDSEGGKLEAICIISLTYRGDVMWEALSSFKCALDSLD